MNKTTKIVCFCFVFLTFSAKSVEIKQFLTTNEINSIVFAIKRAENSIKYPYGIKSIEIKGKNQSEKEEYARKICFNSVKNNYSRWLKTEQKEDFILFMSRRYCPIGASDDPNNLNKNWANNVKKFLANSKIKV